jgi:hypothetical protein
VATYAASLFRHQSATFVQSPPTFGRTYDVTSR